MNERLYILFRRHYQKQATAEETEELQELLAKENDPQVLADLVASSWKELEQPDERFAAPDSEGLRHILSRQEPVMHAVRPLRSVRRRAWAAAAVVLLLLAGAGIYYMSRRTPTPPATVMAADIAPAGNKAVLTLADGSTVALDSANNRVIQQGAAAVRQNGGQLQYDAHGQAAGLSYNVLTTPRGGQFQVRLSDGTRVWLNAASSIKYPVAFEGRERSVRITGEAYFEVAENAQMPFKVNINDQAQVEVLGTHFNVNAYPDESSINTVLLEGAISVKKGEDKAVLQPGQQARIENKGIKIIKDADTAKAMAWKNALFNFDGEGLEAVMRQIARWYDVDVFYEKGVPDIEFVGKMSRQEKLSNLLKGFQGFGVHYRIEENRRVIITP